MPISKDRKDYWDKVQQERRMRYRTDPEYRDAERRRKREERRRKREEKARRREELGGESSSKVLRSRSGDHVVVWQVGEVADYVGVTPERIRGWEKNGYIPPPIVDVRPRHYTLNQMNLIAELARFMTANLGRLRLDDEATRADLDALVERIEANWETD